MFQFTNNAKVGGFYAGLFAIVFSFLGFFSKTHAFAGGYIICCALCALVCLISCVVDGVAYGVIGFIKA